MSEVPLCREKRASPHPLPVVHVCRQFFFCIVKSFRVSSNLFGPVIPSFLALSGRFTFTVRRHKINKDSLSAERAGEYFSSFEQELLHPTPDSGLGVLICAEITRGRCIREEERILY